METLIGIDIGTQGTKAALHAADGRCLAEAFEPSRPSRPGPGIVEEDPDRQVASVLRTIKACVGQAGDPAARAVAGIAIDGQMAGVIGVGADGGYATPYDSWLDTRCAPYIERMEAEAGAEVLDKTGNAPSFNHGPKLLWWMHERPEVFRSVAAWVQPGAYAAMRLCGHGADRAFIDDTYLHFSGFADNRNRRWDGGLCEAFGIDDATLPRIVAPAERVGELAAEGAAACGLRRGVPVIAGCGDTAASFLACGATAPGVCVDVAGTASVFAATTTEPVADHEDRMLGCGRSVAPGLWHPYAYVNGGGMNLEWFRDKFGAVVGDAASLDDLAALAADLPLDDGLPLFVPHLGGRVSPGWPKLRGAWAGLTWDHGPGELYRGMLEAVALEYALYRAALDRLLPGVSLSEVRVTGGGEKSGLWNQIKADVLGLPFARIDRGGGAPMGAAIVAGCGVGLLDGPAAAAEQWVAMRPAAEPDPAAAGFYRRRADRYAALLAHLDLWADPGPA